MSYLPFSRRWAGYLAAAAGLPPGKEAVLAYAVEVLAINLINVLLALALGLLLGVLPGTAACLVAAALFRHTAGGAHSSSPWRCGAITVSVFPLMTLAAASLPPLKEPFDDILPAAALLAGFTAIIRLAPVDCPAAPVVSPFRRKKLKSLSLAVLTILAVILVLLRWSNWTAARQVRFGLVFSIFWVSFMLTGPGHRLISLIDGIKNKK